MRLSVCLSVCMCVCVCVCVCVCGTVQCTFKTSNKETLLKIRVYNGGTYGCENWALVEQHERKTETGNEISEVGCRI